MLDEKNEEVTIEEDLLSQVFALQAVITGLGEKGLLADEEKLQEFEPIK